MTVGRDYLHPGEHYSWADGGTACPGGPLLAHTGRQSRPRPTYDDLCREAIRARVEAARAAAASA